MDGKRTVLLIEDSVTIHRLVDLSINSDEFDITKVFSEDEAILRLNDGEYDFILLDSKLGNIVLRDFVETIRAYQANSRIILLVGAYNGFNQEELAKSGADDYLIKPFDTQSINEKLTLPTTSKDTAHIYEPFIQNDDFQGERDEADIMQTDFIEKMPQADINRETDSFIPAPAPLIGGEADSPLMNVDSAALEDVEEYQAFADVEEVRGVPFADVEEVREVPFEDVADLEHQTAPQTVAESKSDEDNINDVFDKLMDSHEAEAPFADVEEVREAPFEDMGDVAEATETAPLGELKEVNPIQGMDFADVEEATEAPFADVEETSETPFADVEDVADLEPQTAPQTVAESKSDEDNINDVFDKLMDSHEAEVPFADVEETSEAPFADVEEASETPFEDMAESSETDALGELEEVNPIQGMDFADVEEATETPFADVEEVREVPFEDVANLKPQTAPQTVAESKSDEDNINDVFDKLMDSHEAEAPFADVEEATETPFADVEEATEAPFADIEDVADLEPQTAPQTVAESKSDEDNINDVFDKLMDSHEAEAPFADVEEISETPFTDMAESSETAPLGELEEVNPIQEMDFTDVEEATEAPFADMAESSETAPLGELEEVNPIQEMDFADVEEATEAPFADIADMADLEPQTAPQTVAESKSDEDNINDVFDKLMDSHEAEVPFADMAESSETAALGELEEVNPIQGMDFADVEEATEAPFADVEETTEAPFADVEETTEAPFADIEETTEAPFADMEDVVEHQTAPQTVAETTPQTAPLVSAPQSSLPLGSGITITIGREEILSILGRAIDKTILEEAIKEVLAKNMEEIVRAVVPAMAEKYIKAEIERLKNDE